MQGQSTLFEEWRPVVGYEDLYSISSLGRVRRDAPNPIGGGGAGRILRPAANTGGYLQVGLSCANRKRSITVHRLVCTAFFGARPNGYQSNHKDGNKANNAVANLEYVTPKQNTRHAIDLGLSNQSGEANHEAKLTEDQVRLIRQSPAPHRVLAQKFHVSDTEIFLVRCSLRWAHVK